MTPQEAKEWLIAIAKKYIHGGDEGYDKKRKKAIKTAISVLDKQIPKKVAEYIKDGYCCTKCGAITYPTSAYCKHCGQALDWSDTE